MGIGILLKELIEKNNTNVNELAISTGVSPQTIYSIIKRDSMKANIEDLGNIAKYLNVDLNYFYQDNVEWDKSLFDDYRKLKSDEERLLMFRYNGVPRKLYDEYLKLRTKEKPATEGDGLSERLCIFNSLTPEAQEEALRYMQYLADKEAGK